MSNWNQLPDNETIKRSMEALKANGMNVYLVENSTQAKEKVLEILPANAQVMNMTSVTLDSVSVVKEILESGKFNAVRNQLLKMDTKTQDQEMKKMGAAPQWVIGSVHAVTEDGHVLIASNSGSQLPAYAYGATKVIWLIGAQKIVKNTDQGLKRIYEYVLPLESERANKAYKITSGSFVSKLLIVNREIISDRITIILVNEKLGF